MTSSWKLPTRTFGVLLALMVVAHGAVSHQLQGLVKADGTTPDLEGIERRAAGHYGKEYAAKAVEFLRVLADKKDMAAESLSQRIGVEFDVIYALKSEDYQRARLLGDFLSPNGMQIGPGRAPELKSSVDWYKVCFSVTQRCYVYAFQVDATGKVDPLFPNEDILPGESNPVRANRQYRVPGDPDWAFLDDNVGIEAFFIFASRKRKRDMEDLYPYFIRASAEIVAGTWQGKPTVVAPRPKEKPDKAPPTGSVFVVDLEGTITRGLGGVKKAPQVEITIQQHTTVSIRPTLYTASHDEFVQTLWLRHVK